MIIHRAASGALVLSSGGIVEPRTAHDRDPECPACRKAVRTEISRSGYTLTVCGCGLRPVPRVRSTQWVEPPTVNPFTEAEREPRMGRPPRMVRCSVCKAEVSIHATDTRRRCLSCHGTLFDTLWPQERQAALVADYAVLSYHDLRIKYECGYTTITRILTAAGVEIRRPGKRFRPTPPRVKRTRATRPPVGMPQHRGLA